MTGWQRKSPLHYCTASSIRESGLVVRELPHCGKLILQAKGDLGTIRQAAMEVIGQDLPITPNSSTVSGHQVLWLGPRKWLIIIESDTLQTTRQQLQATLSPNPCLVSDVSDSRFRIEVSGSRARSLMSTVCALDLDERSFSAGQCAQTLLVRVPLLLHQVDSMPCFHLYLDRSLAHYAWNWLHDAANNLIDR